MDENNINGTEIFGTPKSYQNFLDQQSNNSEVSDKMAELKKYYQSKLFVQKYRKQQVHDNLVKIISKHITDTEIIESTVEELEQLFRRYNG